ncbi:MAG: M48 family metallopeptidase [Armatimonadetes bacterium]|nr:M48 family metallopeptidase [Armatimonadota bacterium]
MDRKRFPGITAAAFVSEADRSALEALRRVPLLPQVVQKFYEIGADRWMYCWNMAMSVRCGPRQYKTLYEILRESCAILDVPEPELYVTNNPFPNAFAGGVERPYITLRSSIVDTLSDEELFHLMGHELGHIKAGHVLYFSIARILQPLLEMLGRRTFGLGDVASIGLMMAFAEWSRNAEISADRAGLLVAQDISLSIGANLALCAGPSRLREELSQDSFMDQARAYQDMSFADSMGKLALFLFGNWTATHPMPVHRSQQLERWHQTGDYSRILAGHYVGAPTAEAG